MRLENAFSLHVFIAAGMLCLMACSDSTPPEAPSVPISDQTQSVAIRIESDGTGNCNFDASPADLHVAALNTTEYAEAAQCGACLEVEGPNNKKVLVRIVDSCSGCTTDQLALSKQVFDAMGASDYLKVDVRRRYVTCPVQGPVRYRFKEDSTAYWAAIQVRNHLLPIQKLEWEKDGAWLEIKRQAYNYFVQEGMGPGPLHVRLTAIDGQQLEDTLPQVIQATFVDGAAQFKVE